MRFLRQFVQPSERDFVVRVLCQHQKTAIEPMDVVHGKRLRFLREQRVTFRPQPCLKLGDFSLLFIKNRQLDRDLQA